MAESLQKQLSGFPKGMEAVANEEGEVYISYQKVYLPGQTMVCVFVTNASKRTFSNGYTAAVQTQNGLFLRCDANPKADLKEKQNLDRQLLSAPSLAEKKTSTIMIGIFCNHPHSIGNNSIQVRIQPTAGVPVNLTLPVDIKDLIRPTKMSVQQYGGMWKRLPKEIKETLRNASVGDISAFNGIASACNMALVKIIGKECILAAKLVTGSKNNVLCLVHAKVRSGSEMVFMARSSHAAFSAAVLGLVRDACSA
uniref:AP-4 complex subunit epsilon-1 C-terminal domain-containing protein n=1 Tax=Amorphochlora amoebiformis TaxID=1561963 RepID=A0A7S0DS02_9EUKA